MYTINFIQVRITTSVRVYINIGNVFLKCMPQFYILRDGTYLFKAQEFFISNFSRLQRNIIIFKDLIRCVDRLMKIIFSYDSYSFNEFCSIKMCIEMYCLQSIARPIFARTQGGDAQIILKAVEISMQNSFRIKEGRGIRLAEVFHLRRTRTNGQAVFEKEEKK